MQQHSSRCNSLSAGKMYLEEYYGREVFFLGGIENIVSKYKDKGDFIFDFLL
jgi:hypothetical protein